MTPLRSFSSRGVSVETFMPARTGVVQEAGVPLTPSISTRQSRQEPKGSRLSVAQSLGIGRLSRVAARITEVPSGTVIATPSISRETIWVEVLAGVP